MRSLAIFEIDGVLDSSSRAAAVAKQALRSTDWEIAFLTARSSLRAQETLSFLAERLKVSKYPKTSPTLFCGRDTEQATWDVKIQNFQSLIRQHHDIDRVVAYDNNEFVLYAYGAYIKSRSQPRSFSMYRIVNKDPVIVCGSAVYVKPGPSEF